MIASFGPSKELDVLDLGCGTGNYLAAQVRYFGDRSVRWVGADPSRAMLEITLAKIHSARFIRGRAEELPFVEHAFDYVFSGWAFHHFIDKSAALTEMSRVLKRRGMLRVRNIEPSQMRGWWVYRFFPESWDADQVRWWPASKLAAALEARGLRPSVDIVHAQRRLAVDEALSMARARVVSQLAVIDDVSYLEGLHRLESCAAADPDASVDNDRASLWLTASKD